MNLKLEVTEYYRQIYGPGGFAHLGGDDDDDDNPETSIFFFSFFPLLACISALYFLFETLGCI